MHDFTSTTNGDGDDAVRARNPFRSFRSLAGTKHRTQPLRMNWVVVTDKNGSRRLRMQWTADEDC